MPSYQDEKCSDICALKGSTNSCDPAYFGDSCLAFDWSLNISQKLLHTCCHAKCLSCGKKRPWQNAPVAVFAWRKSHEITMMLFIFSILSISPSISRWKPRDMPGIPSWSQLVEAQRSAPSMRIFGIFAWHGVEWLRHWATNITDQIRNMLPHSAKRQHTAHAADIRKKMQRRINTDKVTMMFIKFKMRLSEAFDMLRYTNMQHPGLPDVAKVHLRLVVQGQILWATFAHICLSSSDTKIYKMLTWKMQKTFKILKKAWKTPGFQQWRSAPWRLKCSSYSCPSCKACDMLHETRPQTFKFIRHPLCCVYIGYIYIGYIGVYVCCMNQVNRCSWINREKSAATLLVATKFLHRQLGRRTVHASVTLKALNARARRTTELHPLGLKAYAVWLSQDDSVWIGMRLPIVCWLPEQAICQEKKWASLNFILGLSQESLYLKYQEPQMRLYCYVVLHGSLGMTQIQEVQERRAISLARQ